MAKGGIPTIDTSKFDSVKKMLNIVNEADIDLINRWYKAIEKSNKALTDSEKKVLESVKTFNKYKDVVDSLRNSKGKLSKANKDLLLSYIELDEEREEEKDVLKSVNELLKKSTELKGEDAKKYRELARAIAETNGKEKEFNKMLSETKAESLKGIKEGFNDIKDSIVSVGKPLFDFGKSMYEPWAKASDAAASYARSVGMSADAMVGFRKSTINFIADNHISAYYNKTIEDMMKLQSEYASRTNRNILLTANQKEIVAATAKLMGDENAMEFLGKLENFGVGMEKANEFATKLFNTSTQSGIKYEKYAKTVTDNLSLVNKYNFKNGIEGLASMAKKATEMKLDMQQVASFAEKVNTVEGAITTAANLQVLGGPFAEMANPIAMLYESLNDMEALQDRMLKTFGNLGTFNRSTGQAEIGVFDKWRVREAAKSMGMNPDQVFETINRSALKNDIENYIAGTAIAKNENASSLISNVATYNKETGAYEVGLSRGTVNIKNLKAEDLSELEKIAQSEEKDVKDIARELKGIGEVIKGGKDQLDALKAQGIENSGIGDKLTNIARMVAESNSWLKALVIGQGLLAVGSGIFNGFTNFGKFRGGFDKIGSGFNLGGAGKSISKPGGSATGVVNGKKVTINRYTNPKPGQYAFVRNAPGGGVTQLTRGQVATSLAKNAIKGSAAAGAIAGVATGVIHAVNGDFKNDGTKSGRENKNKAIGSTIGSVAGGILGTVATAALTPFLGPAAPLVGMAIGVGTERLGSLGGKIISDMQTKNRSKNKEKLAAELRVIDPKLSKSFLKLEGDYKTSELNAIKKAIANDGKITDGELSNKLLEKIAKSGDADRFKGLNEVISKVNVGKQVVEAESVTINTSNVKDGIKYEQKAAGGPVFGPPHIEGGVNKNLEGGEFVIRKEIAQSNIGYFDAVNKGVLKPNDFLPTLINKPMATTNLFEGASGLYGVKASSSFIGPTKEIIEKPVNITSRAGINPMSVIPTVGGGQSDVYNGGKSTKIDLSPLSLNLSGTINLNANGQSVDISKLLDNPTFLTELSKLIQGRILDSVEGGNFKDGRIYKQSTF